MQENEPKISFVFENEDYKVSMAACDENKAIRLPDGRVLDVNGWLESYPPQVSGLHLISEGVRPTVDAEIAPRELNFFYDEQKYRTTYRLYTTGKVLLPSGKVLEAKSVDYNTHSFEFKEIAFDVTEGIKNEKIVKAHYWTPEIKFTYENEDYVIPHTSDYSDYLKLPDGRVLKADYWLESNPVQPAGLKVVEVPEHEKVAKVKFQEKTNSFTYEGQEYAVTGRMNRADYILLPDYRVLKKAGYDEEAKQYIFAETTVNIHDEIKSQNIVKADSKALAKKFKM